VSFSSSSSSSSPLPILHALARKRNRADAGVQNRVLELHNKTVISFMGLLMSLTGWFLWNIFLSAIYAQKPGPYLVRGAFLHNFGRNPVWWVTGIMVLSVLVAYELGVASIRRIYFPRDEDLMQEIERYDSKMANGDGAGAGTAREEGLDLEGGKLHGYGAGDGVVDAGLAKPAGGRRSHDGSAGFGGGAPGHDRRSRRLDDESGPPPFTPPAEERVNPFDHGTRVQQLGQGGGRETEKKKKSAARVTTREVSVAGDAEPRWAGAGFASMSMSGAMGLGRSGDGGGPRDLMPRETGREGARSPVEIRLAPPPPQGRRGRAPRS
jgi:hypothetical protein